MQGRERARTWRWAAGLLAPAGLLAATAGCVPETLDRADHVGVIAIDLRNLPPEARCVRVKVTGRETITRTVPMPNGKAVTLTLGGLPLGPAQVTEEVYSAECDDLRVGAAPAWIGEHPASVLLRDDQPVPVSFTFQRGAQIRPKEGGDAGAPEARGEEEGATPGLVVDPPSYDFGSDGAGPVTFVVRNAGVTPAGPLVLRLDATTSEGTLAFATTGDGCDGQTLRPGGVCTVTVYASPPDEDPPGTVRTATLTIGAGADVAVAVLVSVARP